MSAYRLFYQFLLIISIMSKLVYSMRLQTKPFSRFHSVRAFTSSLVKSKNMYSLSSSALMFKVADETETVDQVDTALNFVENSSSSGKGGGSIFKKLSKGVVPIAASIGFAATPSATIATRIAGAAAGGIAGFLVKKGLLDRFLLEKDNDGDDINNGSGGGSKYVKAEIKKAILNLEKNMDASLTKIDLRSIEVMAKKHKVSEVDLKVLFAYVFAEAAIAATQSNDQDLLDLGNLIEFAESVQFTDSEIGEGFSLAATKLGQSLERDKNGFFTRNHSPELLLQSAKLFFLSDKMIKEYRGFYGSRTDTALSFFPPETFNAIISKSCKDMFQSFIQNVLIEPEKFTREEMEMYQSFLSVSPQVSEFRPANMMDLIRESVQYTLDKSLAESSTSSSIDFQALAKAKTVFGWNSFEFEATVEAKTLPVFERQAEVIVNSVIEKPEIGAELSTQLGDLIKQLNIDMKKARGFVMTLISQENARYMNEIQRVYEVAGSSSIEPAFKIMTAYAKTWDGLKALTDDIMVDVSIPIPGLPFAQMVRVNLYQLQLTKERAGQNTGVYNDMFTLNTEQQKLVKKTMALPKVTSWIAQCISENNFNEMAKAAYQKQLNEFGVTEKEWKATSVDFYYQELQKIARMRAVPTDIDMKRLSSLCEFLDAPQEMVSKVNMELLGDKYVKAVSEAMTPTGVIVEEYKDGLERLRDRLQLTATDAQTLLGVAARNRMIPVIKDLVDIFKSDVDGSGRRKKEKEGSGAKDKSGDRISSQDNMLGFMETGAQKEGGGPNVFMREALNLVNFFSENYLTEDISIDSLETMPVTAVGVVPQEDLIGAYKHYLITMLSEQEEDLRSRYEENERLFGMVIGVERQSQQKVKESLAYTAYKNMLMNLLRVKDAVETSDLQQFALLKDRLSLDAETGERVLAEATKGAVLETAAKLIRSDASTITSEVARRFRGQIQSLGLDMRKDTGFNDKLVTYLYALEVQYMIENELESELQEAQEVYDIPTDRAEQIVEACCKKYISQVLNLALRDARKYNEEGTIKWISIIAKYMRFVTGSVDADGMKFTEDDKSRLIHFYEGYLNDPAVGKAEEAVESAARLRALIRLDENFIAPLQGIDSLIGEVSGLKGIAGTAVKDLKKKWAWGG